MSTVCAGFPARGCEWCRVGVAVPPGRCVMCGAPWWTGRRLSGADLARARAFLVREGIVEEGRSQ